MTETTQLCSEQLALAIQHHAEGRFDRAEELYQRLHAADHRDTEVLYLLGLLCCDLGLFDAACRFLEEALVLAPAFPEATVQLAAARSELAGAALLRGDAAAAEKLLLASAALQAPDAELLNRLGLARLQQALALRPGLSQALNNLGLALRHQGDFSAAQSCFEEALAGDRSYEPARINLANALRALGHPARALEEMEVVLAQNPDSADSLNNRGAILQDLGQTGRALQSLTRALELSPESPQIRWNLALTQLKCGDYDNGWRHFESRWEGCDNLRGGYDMPPERRWAGQELNGRRLLLWAEQGFGDTLQFIRFAQDVACRGATVGVRVPKELLELVRRAPGVSAAVTLTDALPDYDFHCPMMSLPARIGIDLDERTLHGATPYLTADHDEAAAWGRRVANHPGLKVGLVWAGNARRHSLELAAIDSRRSIPPRQLAPLTSQMGCTFYSLQKGASQADLADLGIGRPIEDFSGEWADFADTAAFIANLDLVISVDTAVAHLAGALGRPVWLLNRFDCCWRWLEGRTDSPWYASLRQYRQPAPGAWDAVIEAAAHDLAGLARHGGRTPDPARVLE
jgi:Flp pilus assembly protein TadD